MRDIARLWDWIHCMPMDTHSFALQCSTLFGGPAQDVVIHCNHQSSSRPRAVRDWLTAQPCCAKSSSMFRGVLDRSHASEVGQTVATQTDHAFLGTIILFKQGGPVLVFKNNNHHQQVTFSKRKPDSSNAKRSVSLVWLRWSLATWWRHFCLQHHSLSWCVQRSEAYSTLACWTLPLRVFPETRIKAPTLV